MDLFNRNSERFSVEFINMTSHPQENNSNIHHRYSIFDQLQSVSSFGVNKHVTSHRFLLGLLLRQHGIQQNHNAHHNNKHSEQLRIYSPRLLSPPTRKIRRAIHHNMHRRLQQQASRLSELRFPVLHRVIQRFFQRNARHELPLQREKQHFDRSRDRNEAIHRGKQRQLIRRLVELAPAHLGLLGPFDNSLDRRAREQTAIGERDNPLRDVRLRVENHERLQHQDLVVYFSEKTKTRTVVL